MSSLSKFYKMVEVKNSNSETDKNSDRRDSKTDKELSVHSLAIKTTPVSLDMDNIKDRQSSFDNKNALCSTSKDDQMKLKQIILKNHIKNNRHLKLDQVSSDNVDIEEGEISDDNDDGSDIQSDILIY